MAAPLIAGDDLAAMSERTRVILLNREVIAVDQDELGRQGRRVWKDGGREVWVKQLAGGTHAVLLWKRGEAPASITVDWAMLDLPPALALHLGHLWRLEDLGRMRAAGQPPYQATASPCLGSGPEGKRSRLT